MNSVTIASYVAIGNSKKFGFAAIQQFKDIGGIVESFGGHIPGEVNQFTQDVFLKENAGMVINVGRRADSVG